MKKQTLSSDNLQGVLDAASNAADKGTQQYFTPPHVAAALALALPACRPVVTDLTCGNGAMVEASANTTTIDRLGLDIDPACHLPRKGTGNARHVTADLTRFFPLLHEIGWRSDLLVLNPPFSLQWHTETLTALSESPLPAVAKIWKRLARKKTVDSTTATFLIAMSCLSDRGEGLMICNESTASRLFGPGGTLVDLADHLWLWLSTPNFFPGVDPTLRIAAIYFAPSHAGGATRIEVDSPDAGAITRALGPVAANRAAYHHGSVMRAEYYRDKECVPLWESAVKEWKAREKVAAGARPEYNLWLDHQGTIRRHLTPFQEVSICIPVDDVKALDSLHGQTPAALVIQKATRLALLHAVHGNIWTVDPALLAAVDQAVREYDAVRAPLYPLNAVQRLGYLDEQDAITCTTARPGFTIGRRYTVRTETVDTLTTEVRPNLCGEREEIEISGKDLLIEIRDDAGETHAYLPDPETAQDIKSDHTHPLTDLIESFQIPEVADVSQTRPEEYTRQLEAIDQLNATFPDGFRFRNYQREDLARTLMVDGTILAWDPGLGKTLAAFTYGILTGSRRILIVAPGSLHEQIREEGRAKFGVDVKPLLSQEDFYNDTELHTSRYASAHGPQPSVLWRLTTYEALGYNGADEWEPFPSGEVAACRYAHPTMRSLIRTEALKTCQSLAAVTTLSPVTLERIAKLRRLAENHAAQPGEIAAALDAIRRITMGNGEGEEKIDGPLLHHQIPLDPDLYFIGIGTSKHCGEPAVASAKAGAIRCIWAPRLATLCADAFDCVVIDEGVRLKSTDSFVSQGVRSMRPARRLVLTGTPIKNRLEDVFWLAHWACGGHDEASARWPYPSTSEAREQFANDFLLTEFNITAARKNNKSARKKRTNKICNVHRLWKLLGPVILRRRKDDCAEDIVPKTVIPVTIQAGTMQQAVYQRYVMHKPVGSNKNPSMDPRAAIGYQLQLLRQVALCPAAPALTEARLGPAATGPIRSQNDLTPKLTAILSLIVDRLEQGRQIVIFSPFQEFSRSLAAMLRQSGVTHQILDGSVSPANRGILARQFKEKKFAVLVAGLESMSEGHSFHQCADLVLASLSWALDKNAQAIDRVHRLISRLPVNIYIPIVKGTIDELLYKIFIDKKDSSQLALDGRLFRDETGEINLAQLLQDAAMHFDPSAETISEQALMREWPALSNRLRNAEQAYRQWEPPILTIQPSLDSTIEQHPVTTEEIAQAMLTLESETHTPHQSYPSHSSSTPAVENSALAAYRKLLSL